MMRDLYLKKCKEVNFLSIIEHGSLEGSSNNRKLRRCAVYLKGPGSLIDAGLNRSPCIRSLVVFPQGLVEATELLSRKTRKALLLVRVLDLEGIFLDGPLPIANFIHLRYLSIRGSSLDDGLPSGIWYCKYLETLDLRCTDDVKVSNKFWKLERLRHLYLPKHMKLKGRRGEQLALKNNQLQQMETFKNFNPMFCKIEDLGKMVNIRVFTINKRIRCSTKEDIESLLEAPMIKAKRLVKPYYLSVSANVINEDPTILSTRVLDSCIAGVGISGKIEVELNDNVQIFTRHLTCVKLVACRIGEGGIRMLEKLPRLKKLYLSNDGTKVSKICFSKGGFMQLVKLTLQSLYELEELVVEEEGALPNLQYLFIKYCMRMKKITEGFPSSVHIECNPCLEGIEYYNTCPRFKESRC